MPHHFIFLRDMRQWLTTSAVSGFPEHRHGIPHIQVRDSKRGQSPWIHTTCLHIPRGIRTIFSIQLQLWGGAPELRMPGAEGWSNRLTSRFWDGGNLLPRWRRHRLALKTETLVVEVASLLCTVHCSKYMPSSMSSEPYPVKG